MAKNTVKVRLSGWKGGAEWMNGLYHVSHDGRKVHIFPTDWLRNDSVNRLKRKIHPQGKPNVNTRHAIFQKLGWEMNAGGQLFVPMAYRKATGRTTFRGMTFREIRAAQKKY